MERPGRYSSVAILEGFELRGHIHVNRVLLIKQANRYVDCDDFGARPKTQNFIKAGMAVVLYSSSAKTTRIVLRIIRLSTSRKQSSFVGENPKS